VRDDITGLSTFNPGHRSLQRKLVGSASTVETDGNGRIQLPQTLRQVTGLEKRVVLLGMGSRFEIWNETILNQKRVEEERSLDQDASEEMTRLVL
jgi:MraZ protein